MAFACIQAMDFPVAQSVACCNERPEHMGGRHCSKGPRRSAQKNGPRPSDWFPMQGLPTKGIRRSVASILENYPTCEPAHS